MGTKRSQSRTGRLKRQSGEPLRSKDGVDLTLVREMLSLTPAQRLQRLQSTVNMILSLRNGRRES